MLIREMAADVRIPWEKGGKRSFFLVDKGRCFIFLTSAIVLVAFLILVPLVKQQSEQIRVHTDLKIGEYHGGRNTDRWTSDRWEKELKENHVSRVGFCSLAIFEPEISLFFAGFCDDCSNLLRSHQSWVLPNGARECHHIRWMSPRHEKSSLSRSYARVRKMPRWAVLTEFILSSYNSIRIFRRETAHIGFDGVDSKYEYHAAEFAKIDARIGMFIVVGYRNHQPYNERREIRR